MGISDLHSVFHFRSDMRSIQAFAISLLVSLVVHVVMTWPLVGHLTEGIPSSAHDIEKGPRAMMHGDHLQLLYFFWLGGDMLLGETPPFLDICLLYTSPSPRDS